MSIHIFNYDTTFRNTLITSNKILLNIQYQCNTLLIDTKKYDYVFDKKIRINVNEDSEAGMAIFVNCPSSCATQAKNNSSVFTQVK